MVEKGAFKDCASLKSVTIGKNVEKLGTMLFEGCVKLKLIDIETGKLKQDKVKKCLKKSSVEKLVLTTKAAKKQLKNYKKIFEKKNSGAEVEIEKKKK